MGFRYTFRDKALFYWGYFFRKVFCLWFEVKRPRLRMFLYEMAYSARKLINYKSLYPSPFGTDMVETVFGRFRIRPRTTDMSNASPAFERRDVDYLLELLGRLRDEGKKILFLDIGADIGTFAVTVGNRFGDYGGLKTMAFEPAATSFKVLEENIRLNGLQEKTGLYNFPLYSEDGLELDFSFNPEAPGSSVLSPGGTETVVARTLDSVLAGGAGDYDALVFKIDVEGVECEILRGARETLASVKESYLMVEDFVNPEIITCLGDLKAGFMAKLTPYNSFWVIRPGR